MKSLQVIALAAGMMLMAPIAFAQTKEEHESHHPDANITAPAAAQQDAKSAAGMEGMQSMQKNMKAMHELMGKIQSSNDPAEKTQLLKQHMQAMVSTEGTRRVKPSVYFRPTAQPTSVSPASRRMIQAMTRLRCGAGPSLVLRGKRAVVRAIHR